MPYVNLSHEELCTVRLAMSDRRHTLETRLRGNREYIAAHFEGHALSDREMERMDALRRVMEWDEEEIARCTSALENLDKWRE